MFRITVFAPREDWLATAATARLPGIAVVAAVTVFNAGLLVVASWPREYHARGEFRKGDTSEWKETDR